MTITRQDIAQHLERGVRTNFLIAQKNFTPLRAAFVQDVSSDGAFEDYADMGAPPWPVQNAGKPGVGGTTQTNVPKVNRTNAGEVVTTVQGEERGLRVYNIDWEINFPLTHNAINDNRAGNLMTWASSAGVNFERHKDFLSFDALNSGGAVTNYGAGYDGLSFFNDSHIDPGAEYQDVQDNSFALALSLDNYETVKVAGSKFKDGRGQPIGMTHNLLIVPTDLERTGSQITTNREAFDTADRETNPYAGVTRMLVAPGGWLDTTSWFTVDTSTPERPLLLQTRMAPTLDIVDDKLTGSGGTRYFIYKARYTIFYGDWRLALQGNT